MHQARERAPRDFVGDAALRDDVAAPDFTTLGGDPEHLVLQPAQHRLGRGHALAADDGAGAARPRDARARPRAPPGLTDRACRRPIPAGCRIPCSALPLGARRPRPGLCRARPPPAESAAEARVSLTAISGDDRAGRRTCPSHQPRSRYGAPGDGSADGGLSDESAATATAHGAVAQPVMGVSPCGPGSAP